MLTDRYFESIRRRTQAERDARVKAAYEAVPELKEIDSERRKLFTSVAFGKSTAADAADAISRLTEKEQRLLEENGLPADTLTIRPNCPVCNDTGWTGSERRRPCRCRLLYQAESDPSIGINSTDTFESFSCEIQPQEEQRTQAKRAKAVCIRYADALPSPEKKNILLIGSSGLGKSFLGNAIARRALENGVAAKRVTASELIRLTMKALSERTVEDSFRNVPLLVLDDLGTEPQIPNVSEETLFSLIESRIAHGLCTVIISNLSGNEMQDRYGERLTSRLADADNTLHLRLSGDNLRWRKQKC